MLDPNGNTTNGITRTQTSQTSFSMNGDDMKSTSSGGIDSWSTNQYLNIHEYGYDHLSDNYLTK